MTKIVIHSSNDCAIRFELTNVLDPILLIIDNVKVDFEPNE